MSVGNRPFADGAPIVAVLRKDGTILRVNDAWKTFGERNGLSPEYEVVGENYLEVTGKDDEEHAARVEAGLGALLAGERSVFTTVYPCHGPEGQRWFRLWATPVVDEPLVLAAHHRVAPWSRATGRGTISVAHDPPGERKPARRAGP